MKTKNLPLTVAAIGMFAIGIFAFNACNKEDEKTDTGARKETPTQTVTPKAGGTLGYLDATGAFKTISNTALQNFYREILQLDAGVQLGQYSIMEQGQGSQTVYTVRMNSLDNKLKIATDVKRYGTVNFIMNGTANTGTCTCTSSACASNGGCDADTFIGCKCTPCSGDCKKTSTSSTRAFIQAFFSAQAGVE